MNYLLDTHILIWAMLEPAKLRKLHQSIIEDSKYKKYISSTSIWEISLKYSIGKLELAGHNPEEFLDRALELGFQLLTPSAKQLASFYRLPLIIDHKDPFDRMLIWQAIESDCVLLSRDRKLGKYDIHGLRLA
jgi:PIN domain nuclease of toxin-antitoxin system